MKKFWNLFKQSEIDTLWLEWMISATVLVIWTVDGALWWGVAHLSGVIYCAVNFEMIRPPWMLVGTLCLFLQFKMWAFCSGRHACCFLPCLLPWQTLSFLELQDQTNSSFYKLPWSRMMSGQNSIVLIPFAYYLVLHLHSQKWDCHFLKNINHYNLILRNWRILKRIKILPFQYIFILLMWNTFKGYNWIAALIYCMILAWWHSI